ncbi:hypothetical protein [Corynebacterium sp. HMSC073D01]|uniref:hypothetical protein n=1 Tax=Corynebacterium sp. HMSC073D01 TaxID=1739536 RepID=UPI0008A2EB5F|nr:hypothetical protein [Corynebacterium sp. HMSC073D01]OFO48805.1 hypothetical protein HMPREF3044_08125 [Corynebacterium sp. HMSC073D01]
MTVEIVNLTPHSITIVGEDNSVLFELPGSQHPARVTEHVLKDAPLYTADTTVPCFSVGYSSVVENLPDESPDSVYVVSQLVLQALPNRSDLYFPFPVVRDKNNQIIGCRGLGRLS